VQLNAAFVEPLVAQPLALGARDAAAIVVAPVDDEVAKLEVNGQRVLAVVGPGVDPETVAHCVALDWVVLGDATSQGTVSFFDPLLRDERFAAAVTPDLVVRIGGLAASRVLQEQLDRWNVRTVALSGAGFVADPGRLVHETVGGLPRRDVAGLRGDSSYVARWMGASSRVGEWLSSMESDDDALDEPTVARCVVSAAGAHQVPLVVGSSMPFRDVEWWAPPRSSPTYSNRGANGIDGVVSTVLGVCAGTRGLGLVGDLTMLHDVSGLVDGLGDAGGSCVLVVVDNNGGGIFSFLPQAAALGTTQFEQLFGTPRSHDLARIAEAFGHTSVTVATRAQLFACIDAGLARAGVTVVIARVPSREENVRRHEQLNEAVQRCWSAGGQ
jgi:2-succinyl-5-enolpyruvyl-6-hydroxy-3-cyclohexene-1-carboxylate synthase